MSRFQIKESPIDGLLIIERKPLADERGYLERMFCDEELEAVLGSRRIVQINRTLTSKLGVVRGMHYQPSPHAEMKIVSCLRGKVFDVAVDLRQDSPTFLNWHAEILTEENYRSLAIPEGFAHGFQTLTDDCEMLYFHTAAYNSTSEGGVHPLDPALAIEWPLPAGAISARDSSHPYVNIS
jgi:dTDP-4-dehydrorhamnose 3,5-epimerase